MEPSSLKVAVIGAGLGGLSTAIALLKQGFEVQVYERAQSLRPVGAGLTLLPNGLNSLAAVYPEVVETLKQAGSHTQMINLKKSTGEMVLSQPTRLAEQFGQPMLNIRWSRLQEILAQFLPAAILHLDHSCTGFEQSDEAVIAHFANQNSIQADLLIGTDGINSIVRQTLVGDGSPRYAGRLSWRAVVPFPSEMLSPNEATLMISPDGKKNCLLADVGEGYLYWSAGVLDQDGSLSCDPQSAKLRVSEILSGWAAPLPTIISSTPADVIVERPICDRPPSKSWSQGRVMLLGDAAHAVVPSLGQGANMAFEDACELAHCLAQASTIEAAFHAYETRRLPRTEVIYARSASDGNRAYQVDDETTSETTSREVLEISQLSQEAFDNWLYGYKP
ncbi:FAD-dependent monooxygenase [Phormidium tenue FACHB-886]|nr:FAD-dependent monooxygenase [Phormidium tenue FACHB-886]